jgi:hypothetical protein
VLLATSIIYGEDNITNNNNNNNIINQNSNTSTAATDNKILEYKFEPFLILGGKDFKDISHNNTLSLQNFAIAAWVKTNQTNRAEPAHLVNKGGFNTDEKGENMNYGIWFSPDGTISGGFETESGQDFEVKSTSKYNDGKWHFILFSYDGSLLRIYIDGTQISSKNTNGAIPDTTGDQPLRIGANSLDESKFFTGYIDEIRVWNRGLTDKEISEIYTNNTFDSKGLVVYLNFGNDEISTKNNISSSSSSSSSTINNPKSIENLTSTSTSTSTATTTTTNNGSTPHKINETTSLFSSTSSPLLSTLKTNPITITPTLPLAQKDKNDEEEDENEDDDKLVVRAHINLQNVDLAKTKFIRVVGFINGEGIKQDIPLSSIDKTKKTLKVDLQLNKDNNIVEADIPDEFFVCAYQIGEVQQEYNNSITKFDCNEGDLLQFNKPTEVRLFSSDSQVYAYSLAAYNQQVNLNQMNNIQSDTVKIKILVPLSDKKDTEKLVIAAMIKGQIQSEVIEDVQAELDDKSDDNTIKRTFVFDRDTDVGKIQIGDRFHACVSSEDLRPPEGTECEKRLVKHLDKANSLPVR